MNMKNFKLTRLVALSSVLLVAVAIQSCDTVETQQLDDRNWELTWSDEFDGQAGSSPDASTWNFDIGTGQDGWGNQELQYYTNRPSNVSLDGSGNLVITARRESFGGMPFTSGRINTKDKVDQAYGRIEARIKNPYGPGLWPAFWMLGADIDQVGWPQTGEIDIMEMRGQIPNVISGSLHGPGYSGGNPISGSYGLQHGRFDDDFYLYAVEWYPDRIDFFVNDYLYNRITPDDATGEWVFNKPFFLILNVAVGGTYVGFPIDATPFPQQMVVDYVRMYRLAE
jgi:beta-glucanase (GH16 family)